MSASVEIFLFKKKKKTQVCICVYCRRERMRRGKICVMSCLQSVWFLGVAAVAHLYTHAHTHMHVHTDTHLLSTQHIGCQRSSCPCTHCCFSPWMCEWIGSFYLCSSAGHWFQPGKRVEDDSGNKGYKSDSLTGRVLRAWSLCCMF